jgi:hypothetical protein
MRAPLLSLCILAGIAVTGAVAEPAAKMVTSTFLGGPGTDTLRHAAFAPDGSLWVAGHGDASPAQAAPLPFPADPASSYGHSFVARLTPDLARISSFAWAPKGAVEITTVLPLKDAVYMAGYATPALEPLAESCAGAVRSATRGQKGLALFTPAEHYTHPRFDTARDERGTPFIARLSPDLSRIDGFTFLEGWQTRWHVPRPLVEDWTQKVLVTALPDGDLIVVHDGGYNRIPEAGGEAALEHFYHAPDHASRLSPDLKVRRWKSEISMNPVEPAPAGQFLRRAVTGHAMTVWNPTDPAAPWPWPSLGNTHCLDLVRDASGAVLIAGYSSSRTSQEPWWAPFVARLTPEGKLSPEAFAVNPMSGDGGRLNGLVSDSAIAAVGLAADGSMLFSGIADGGNTVLRQHPLDYTRPTGPIHGNPSGFKGRVLFWGLVGRLHATSKDLTGGAYIFGQVQNRLEPAWATGVQGLPGGYVAVAGRNGQGFGAKGDAGAPGPGSFLRAYDPKFGVAFSAGHPGVRLVHLATRGKLAVAVGDTQSATAALLKPAQPKMAGPGDGFLTAIEMR